MKISISGKGYEEFKEAQNLGYFKHGKTFSPGLVLQIGRDQYYIHLNRAVKVNPGTRDYIIPRYLGTVLKNKKWTVELDNIPGLLERLAQ